MLGATLETTVKYGVLCGKHDEIWICDGLKPRNVEVVGLETGWMVFIGLSTDEG